MLAAAALLATSVAPAGARTLDSQVSQDRAPDSRDSDGARGDDLEPVEVVPLDGPERGFTKLSLGTGTEPRTYLIRLQDAAVPTYAGEKPGLAPTAPEPGAQLESDSPATRAYVGHLEQVQVEFVQHLERTVGRAVEVPFTYQFAVNGLAAVLTPEEALQIAADPAVASISLDEVRELHTDAGPQWIGAGAVWNAMAELGLPENVKGEGIVIGTIDTGISPGNSSFADIGDDGYDHTNPLGAGNYLGACDPANTAQFDPNFICNDKLIGAYVFGGANETAVDYDGHGSHTSSTSGGNVVNDVVVTTAAGFVTPPFDISGVAPHANVISYLGCCTLSGLTAAINQAIADEVDAINYSIGSDSPSALWSDFDAVGFLNARAAGIFVATSNGNAGPGFATTGSPADAPWIMSVGASTHNRHNGNILAGLTRDDATTLPDIPGKSVTGALATPTPITYAGAVGDPFCEDTTGNEAAFTGRIVICDRGGAAGRVQKSSNVAGQGAIGFVLVNDANHGRLAPRRRVRPARRLHRLRRRSGPEGLAGGGVRPCRDHCRHGVHPRRRARRHHGQLLVPRSQPGRGRHRPERDRPGRGYPGGPQRGFVHRRRARLHLGDLDGQPARGGRRCPDVPGAPRLDARAGAVRADDDGADHDPQP